MIDSARSLRLAVVVLNYQNADDTLRCVDSLQRSDHRNLFPIVVDNRSDPSVLEELRALDPRIPVLRNPTNLGYAGGNNVGIEAALDLDADAVWILNPDTTVEPTTASVLVRALATDPTIGIVGSRILHGGSNPLTIAANGGAIDLGRGGASSHIDSGELDAETPARPFADVGYVTGDSMMVRSEVFARVGMLPEDYFLYFEETDFNLKVRQDGWRTAVDQRSRVHHFRQSHGPLPRAYYIYYYLRNRLLFADRWTQTPRDDVIADLEPFIEAWRTKVDRNRPSWSTAYDYLVLRALEDGAKGIRGECPGIAALDHPRLLEEGTTS